MPIATRPPGGSSLVQGPIWKLCPNKFAVARVGATRASHHVKNELGVGTPAAEAYIRRELGSLTSAHYVRTEVVFGHHADVYGLRNEHGDWYIKFYEEHGRVNVTSFHPPERDLHCVGGLTLKGYMR